MNTNDQKVTIVLNSHNRPVTLIRTLRAITQHYKNTKVLIIDSSNPSKREMIEGFMHQNTDPNFVEISVFSEKTPVFKKLLMASNIATTKYIQYFADDDAVCPDTIIDRVDFLEYNEGFCACLGRQYYCEKVNDKYSVWFEFQGQQGTFCNDNPFQRIQALSENWVSFSYATMRTDVGKKVFKLAYDIDPNGNFFGERIFCLALLFCGKVNLLDIPSICLSVHKGTKSEELSSLDKTIFAKNSGVQYDIFKKTLSRFLEETLKSDETNELELGEWFMSRHLAFWILTPPDQPHEIKKKAFKDHLEYVSDYTTRLKTAITEKTETPDKRNAFLTGRLHNEAEKMLDILTAI
jgi:glycosyltransferase domain-containing protein